MYLLPPDFQTERLSIAYHSLETLSDWMPFFSHRENLRYLGLDEQQTDEQLCRQWIERQMGRYEKGHGAVLFKDTRTGKVIGNAGLLKKNISGQDLIEIGYSLMYDARGQGYATEMARSIRDHAFTTIPVLRLCSTIDPDNKASQKVALRNGMKKGEKGTYKGATLDIWSIDKSEWKSLVRPNSQQ